MINIVGQKFNNLTVISRAENDKFSHRQYLCTCDCGNSTIIREYSIISGATKSCGCFRSVAITKRNKFPKKSNRRFFVNSNFFEKIDTEEKAYILGFLTADGDVFRKTLSFVLSQQDREMLEKISRNMVSDYPIYDYEQYSYGKTRNFSRIGITDEKIISDLYNLGVGPNKTTIVKCASILPNLQKHYFRGLVDGDGCVFASYDKHNNYRSGIYLLGTESICDGFKDFIISNDIESKSSVRKLKSSNIYEIRYCGNRVFKSVFTLLYSDSSIYLERKYLKGKEILDNIKG